MYVHANCMHICTTNSVYAGLEQTSSSSWFVGAEVESLAKRLDAIAWECERAAQDMPLNALAQPRTGRQLQGERSVV